MGAFSGQGGVTGLFATRCWRNLGCLVGNWLRICSGLIRVVTVVKLRVSADATALRCSKMLVAQQRAVSRLPLAGGTAERQAGRAEKRRA